MFYKYSPVRVLQHAPDKRIECVELQILRKKGKNYQRLSDEKACKPKDRARVEQSRVESSRLYCGRSIINVINKIGARLVKES